MTYKMMVKIPLKTDFSYPILIGASIDNISDLLPTHISFNKIVIITDNSVKKYYGMRLLKSLKKSGKQCLLLSFPPGERFKTLATKSMLENKMLRHSLERDTLILALGGGIVGDLSGFIAATYLRGVPYIQIPTTLLSMVDSSIGGKTAINTQYGKNQIGIVYQPIAVIADFSLLQTISKRHTISGLIEAIKMFLTYDAKSLNFIKLHLHEILHRDTQILIDIVKIAVKIKADVVRRDEKERGERSVLNFGHTIGHALEKVSDYTLLHGYAVGYGILVEANISHALNLLSLNDLLFIKELLAKLGISGKYLKKYKTDDLIRATKNDKKVKNGNVRYTLLNSLGKVHVKNGAYVHPVSDKIVKNAILNTIEG